MFHEERTTVPDGVEELLAEYAADLAAVVDEYGVEEVVDRTGLDRSTVEAIGREDLPDLSLEEAAAVQALADGTPDPETTVEIACDHLLLGMSAAVLDVDTLASELDVDLTPKEVQQKLERRAPMSFEEFVAIEHVVAGRR